MQSLPRFFTQLVFAYFFLYCANFKMCHSIAKSVIFNIHTASMPLHTLYIPCMYNSYAAGSVLIHK